MASHKRRDYIEFDPDEITVLLKLVGRESPKSITDLGLDVDAFERVYAALSQVAYAPMRESHP